MAAIQYHCPSCAAPLVFDGQEQEMTCQSCGNTLSVEGMMQAAALQIEDTKDTDLHWHAAENAGFDDVEKRSLHTCHCTTCGAELVTDAVAAATECIYCGNPTIMPEVFSGGYRPKAVLPFKTTKEQAQEAFRNHCKSKRLLPNGFFDNSLTEKITGIYVPFWLFQCETESDITYKATRVSVTRSGNYETTRTAHYLLRRGGHVGFKQVPVDGSSKMEDAMMESIEPFHADEAQAFNIAYLSGYQAQRHDVDAAACQPRANERIRTSVQSLMRDTVIGYTSVVPTNTQIKLDHGEVEQVLFPVWILNTRWRDRVFTFAMNGQTGQFIGDLPMDKGKFWRWLLGLFAGISAAGYGIAMLLAWMGVF